MHSEQLPRIIRCLSWAIAGLVILLSAISTVISLRQLFRSYHMVLVGDQWETIWFLSNVAQGNFTFSELFTQHNEHRIVLPRIVFALDLMLAGARNTVNFASILICQALHVLLFHRMIARRIDDAALRLALTAFVALLFFCIVQRENLYWGLQIAFVGVFLTFTLSAYLLSGAQAERSRRATWWKTVAVGLLAGTGAALTLSNGAVALLCIAAIFLAARLFNSLTAVTTAVGLAVLIAYVAGFTPIAAHTPLSFAFSNGLLFTQYLAIYIGGLFAPLGLKMATVAGILGLVLSGLAVLALLTGRLVRDRVNLTLIAILAFVVLSAGMTSLGRMSLGLAFAAASRYATPSALFWTALVCLAVLLIAGSRRTEHRTFAALTALLAVTIFSVWSITESQNQFRYEADVRNSIMRRATDAILSSVRDDDSMRILYPSPNLLEKHYIPMIRERRFNIFSEPQPWAMGAQVPEDKLIDSPGRCIGRLDRVDPVTGTGDAKLIHGWAWDPNRREVFGRLIVLSDDRRVIGYGSSGIGRPDVSAAHPDVPGRYVGWAAYAKDAAGNKVNVYGLAAADSKLCRIGSADTPPEVKVR